MGVSSCGEWGIYHEKYGVIRWFCDQANCFRPRCRTKFYFARIDLLTALIDEYKLTRFFTLTLDREFIKGNAWDYIHDPWSKFRKRMNRKFDNFKFVAILESHKDRNFPHIHGFTNIWMSTRQWSFIWNDCKGGRIVWLEAIEDKNLSSYVSKSIEVSKYVGKENLLVGHKQRGNHRTLWRSRGMKAKFELQREPGWNIIKRNVFDEEGELTDFYSEKGVWANGKEE